MSLLQSDIDRGADALRRFEQRGRMPSLTLRPWDALPNSTKKKWRDKAEIVARAIATTSAHDWVTSTLGHGETMCRKCHITNREAAAIGVLDSCGKA